MKKKVQDVYSEILRLRNEFYQQWQENDEPSDHNRIILKAKYEAFDKALELLTPSIVDPQPKESIEYNPFDDFRHTDSEEPVSEDLEEEWKRYITSEEYLNDIPGGLPVARHFANWQKQQTMKDFPIWKKSKKLIEGALLDRGILYIPRYMIELSELKKLPKEE